MLAQRCLHNGLVEALKNITDVVHDVRSNRNFEIYFINGRFIRSGVIAKAIEEGYKQYLMQHKFPLCVLHITMDTETVDVNVHPSKMDVHSRTHSSQIRTPEPWIMRCTCLSLLPQKEQRSSLFFSDIVTSYK